MEFNTESTATHCCGALKSFPQADAAAEELRAKNAEARNVGLQVRDNSNVCEGWGDKRAVGGEGKRNHNQKTPEGVADWKCLQKSALKTA